MSNKYIPEYPEPIFEVIYVEEGKNFASHPEASTTHSTQNEYTIEKLEKDNANLYSQRCILSNKLKDPAGSEAIRIENISIIEQIEFIVNQIKANRQKIRDLRAGDVNPSSIPDDPIEITIGSESYTMSDLKALSYSEMVILRDRLRQQLWRAKQRSEILKKKKSRDHNKQKAIVKEYEISLIDKLKAERKQLERHG